MKRVYYHYTEWEDFQHGMYDEVKEGRKERVEQAVYLLTHDDLCYEYMKRVSLEWVHAVEQVFTHRAANHRSFLGQCACNLYAGIKEDETREAWKYLSEEQRYKANAIADRVHEEWMRDYEKTVGN